MIWEAYRNRRGPGCECDYNFTCRECLRNAPPWHNTPAREGEREAREAAERTRRAGMAEGDE
jgi:hypothetical protein